MFNFNILKEKLKRLHYNKALLTIPSALLTFSVINNINTICNFWIYYFKQFSCNIIDHNLISK